MSVSSIATPVQYLGNGLTTTFAYPYRFLANTDLVVQVTSTVTLVDVLQLMGPDYTVTGVGDVGGGAIVFRVAPPVGAKITIFRDTPRQQPVDYVAQDNFPAESHELALDRVTFQGQDLTAILARGLRVPRTVVELPQLDAPTFRGKVVGFNQSMQPDGSVSLDDIRTVILANPVAALTDVTDYGSLTDEVSDTADYGTIT